MCGKESRPLNDVGWLVHPNAHNRKAHAMIHRGQVSDGVPRNQGPPGCQAGPEDSQPGPADAIDRLLLFPNCDPFFFFFFFAHRRFDVVGQSAWTPVIYATHACCC